MVNSWLCVEAAWSVLERTYEVESSLSREEEANEPYESREDDGSGIVLGASNALRCPWCCDLVVI